MTTDAELREMVREAYRDLDMRTPLARIERSARVRPRRRLVATAAAASVAAVLLAVGMSLGRIGWDGYEFVDVPPSPSVGPSAESKPPRPTSSATTASGRCVDYTRQEYGGAVALPPLRFDVALSDRAHRLLLFADERTEYACWLTPEGGTVARNTSNLTTNQPSHPIGQLSNSSSANGAEPFAAYTFGRAPGGTTQVEVHFPYGPPTVATLAGGWYLATATGQAAYSFSDITEIVAYGKTGPTSLPVPHG
jgi:hypothetical protein